MAVNNIGTGAINFIAMLLSIPVIGVGIWLSSKQDNACLKVLQWPIIILGISILAVGLMGFVGSFWRIPWLLVLYLAAMLVLIILLVLLVVFIYMVTLRGSAHVEPNRACLEYRLDDFSGWLRKRVEGSNKWDRIRSCLSSTSMCAELSQRYRLAQDFFNAHTSPLQSGCCKPPIECGHTFVNPTYWISPLNNAADMDCLQWNNDQTQLCYSCSSCKAGLLANLRKEWRKANLVLIITLVALICVYVFRCCSFRNARSREHNSKYKQGYT